MRDERGASLSGFAVMWVFALVLVCGLVVDGGQKVTAARRAESAAAGAARAATDATATARLGGHADVAGAVLAAKSHLRALGVDGEVTAGEGRVHVRTRASAATIFLSLVGVRELCASGEAYAELRRA